MRSITYRNKTIYVIPHVYEPSEDSFLLVDAMLDTIHHGDRVLEVGCGSAIVSIFARDYASCIVATDINPHAVKCAWVNGIDAVRTDLISGIGSTFDLVVFNPPYLPTIEDEHVGEWEDLMLDGGPDGRRTIERFLAQIRENLTPEGRLLLLVSSLTGIQEICILMQNAGLTVEPVAESRYFFEQLVVLKGTG